MEGTTLTMSAHPLDSGDLPTVPQLTPIESLLNAKIKEMVVAQYFFSSRFEDFSTLIEPMSDSEARDFLEILRESGPEELGDGALWQLATELAAVSYPFRRTVAEAWLKDWNSRTGLGKFARAYPEGEKLAREAIVRDVKEVMFTLDDKVGAAQQIVGLVLDQIMVPGAAGGEVKVALPVDEIREVTQQCLEWLKSKAFVRSFIIGDEITLTMQMCEDSVPANHFRELYSLLPPTKQGALAQRVALASRRVFATPFDANAYHLTAVSSADSMSTVGILLAEFPFPTIRTDIGDILSTFNEEDRLIFTELLFRREHFAVGEESFRELAERASVVPETIRSLFVSSWCACWRRSLASQSFLASTFYAPSFPDAGALFIEVVATRVKDVIHKGWVEENPGKDVTAFDELYATGSPEKVVKRIAASVLKHEGQIAFSEFEEGVESGAMIQVVFTVLAQLGIIARPKFDKELSCFHFFVGPIFQTEEEGNLVKVDEIFSTFDDIKQQLFAWLITKAKAGIDAEGQYPDDSSMCLAAAEMCRDSEPVDILLLYFPFPSRREKMRAVLSQLDPQAMFNFVLLLDDKEIERLSEEDYMRVVPGALEKGEVEWESYFALQVPYLLFPIRNQMGRFIQIVEKLKEEERRAFACLFCRRDLGLETLSPDDLFVLIEKIAKKEREKRYPILKVTYFLSRFPYPEGRGLLVTVIRPLSVNEKSKFCLALGNFLHSISEKTLMDLLLETSKVPPPFRLRFMNSWVEEQRRAIEVCSKKVLSQLVMQAISRQIPYTIQLGRIESKGDAVLSVETFIASGREVAERLISIIISNNVSGTIELAQLEIPEKFRTDYQSRGLLDLLHELKAAGLLLDFTFGIGTILYQRNDEDRSVYQFLDGFPYQEDKKTLIAALKRLSEPEKGKFCRIVGEHLPTLERAAVLELLTSASLVPPPFRSEFVKKWIARKPKETRRDILVEIIVESVSERMPRKLIESIVSGGLSGTVKQDQLENLDITTLLQELKLVGLLAEASYNEGTVSYKRNDRGERVVVVQEEDPLLAGDREWGVRLGLGEREILLLGTISDRKSRRDILAQMVRLPQKERALAFPGLYLQAQCRLHAAAAALLTALINRDPPVPIDVAMLNHKQIGERADLILELLPLVESVAVDGVIQAILQAGTRDDALQLVQNLKGHLFWSNYQIEKSAAGLLTKIREGKEVSQADLIKESGLRCEEDVEALLALLEGKDYSRGYTYEQQKGIYRFTCGNSAAIL